MAKVSAKPEGEDAPEEGEGAAAPAKKKWSLMSLLLFVGAPAVVVIGGGVGAYLILFSGGDETQTADGAGHGEAHGQVSADGHGPAGDMPHAAFFDLPDVLVNLASGGSRPTYLKLAVALELPDAETQHAIEPLMPRVLDNFQVYLRELRLEDLQGSAGMFRLKEELVRRVNLAVAPAEVKDVLFKEMIIQ